jgi:formate dehydrogenase alpha subunit
VGCEIFVHTQKDHLVRVTAKVGSGVNNGNLCVKGRFGMDYQDSPDRLTTPLVRDESGDLVPASWDVALARVEDNFKRIHGEAGGKAFGVLASAKCTNEENYVIQKFARGVLGTNNVDHCARL